MELTNSAKRVLDSLINPTKSEMKDALLQLDMTVEDFAHLPHSKEKPYYRKLLYQNESVELLVMKWSDIECAPHDHGNSHGWIQVINGTSLHTVYEVDENGIPAELFNELQQHGNLFHAPIKGIHKMQASEDTDLITLHLYSPPITGMKVYDLEKCAACVVSDDCGAWWPDDQRQKVREIQLKKTLSN
jgi:cysteine dioxygenase